MTELEYRSYQVREVEKNSRTFIGIAVPYDTRADIAGIYGEIIERGAVEIPASGKVLLYWRHSEPIGIITRHEDTDAGWEIEARISETPRGDEAYTLLRDGVVDELSIGFKPLEHREDDETGDITRTRIEVRETSLVPFGAYGTDATVTEVRSDLPAAAAINQERADMPENNTAAEVAELRAAYEELERSVETRFEQRDETPIADTRNVGQILKAIVSGDEATVRHYGELVERAYEGGTTADSPIKDAWVGDLTRLFDSSSGVLSALFATGPLPAQGLNIEFAELDVNTLKFEEQVAEGDPIPFGNVKLKTRTAPVHTYAGGTQLSRQEIERSTLPVLNRTMEALTLAAGARKKAVLRAAFDALVAARVTAGDVVDLSADPTATDWLDAVVDAAINFEAKAANIDALIVSPDVFKAFNSPEWIGQRLFRVGGSDHTVGSLDLRGLKGDIASLPVIADTGATGTKAAFVNGRAIRQYDSALVHLSDEDISTLTKSFAAYRYGSVATEIPGFVVPVKFA